MAGLVQHFEPFMAVCRLDDACTRRRSASPRSIWRITREVIDGENLQHERSLSQSRTEGASAPIRRADHCGTPRPALITRKDMSGVAQAQPRPQQHLEALPAQPLDLGGVEIELARRRAPAMSAFSGAAAGDRARAGKIEASP